MSNSIRYGASLALALTGVSLTPIWAQQGQDSEARQDTVIITGTRRASRSAIDSPAPVDVVSGDELVNQGDNDVSNILRTSVPSYNVNTQAISDAATLIRPANLRGLSPDNTLVLVNGKRMHRGAVIAFLGGGVSDGAQGQDISTIPAIALKQVEVLRDGASSQYGSDAIAGVINFILKDDAEGGSFEVKMGETFEGDGDTLQFAANAGFQINENGFLNVSAEWQDTDATSRSVQRTDAAALIADGNTDIANPAQIWGQPNVNGDLKLYANFGLDLTDTLSLYAFGNYAERETEGGFFFRNPTNRDGVYTLDDGATLLIGDLTDDGSGNCPTGVPTDAVLLEQLANDPNCFAFTEMLPGGFTPRFGGELEDRSYAVGLRGVLGFGSGLNYDVSYRYGENQIDFFINNTINASLGPDTPRNFRPGGYGQVENLFNLDFSYALDLGLASDLNVAFGYEYRDEEFELRQGDAASFDLGPLSEPSTAYPVGQGFSSSSNGFGGFAPNAAGKNSQSNDALYVDLEADVTEALTLQGALRFEDNEVFGDSTNFKLGGLYRINENFRLRGTYSTGFHVPTAGQSNVVNVTTAFSGGVLQDEGTFPLISSAGTVVADYIEAQGEPRPTLEPEEAENYTLGAAFSINQFNVTIDYFNIKLDDRISRSSSQPFAPALEYLAAQNNVTLADGLSTSQIINTLDMEGVLNADDFAGAEDLTSFAFFNNAFDTETQGVDIVVAGPLKIVASGDTRLAIAANFTETEVTRRDSTMTDGRVKVLEEGLPRFKGSATITHQENKWRALGRLNYFGEGFEDHLDSDLDFPIDIDAALTFDAELGYTVFENLELIGGVQNLFDQHPNKNPFSGAAGAEYPVTNSFGFNGGFYYMKARYTW